MNNNNNEVEDEDDDNNVYNKDKAFSGNVPNHFWDLNLVLL